MPPGPFLWSYQSVVGGGTFMSVASILFFALLWHYETTSPAGKAPTPGAKLSSSLGVLSLAHLEIADL